MSAAGNQGRLIAVCGLNGGAGTTTLAALLALEEARGEGPPVLLCDLGGPAAALASYFGARSPRGALAAAEAFDQGRLNGSLFVSVGARLRLIACEPELDGDESPSLAGLLAQAREAHGATVVDCGTLQRACERELLGLASHVVWVTSAEAIAAGRAEERLFAAGSASPSQGVLAIRAQRKRLALRPRAWGELAERFSLALAALSELSLPDRLDGELPRGAVQSVAALARGLR